MFCVNEKKHEEIFIKIKNDRELMDSCLILKFTGSAFISFLNKIISMDGVELNVYVCNLILSLMSSLQTIENMITYIDCDNKSVSTMTKLYIQDMKL